MAGKIKKEKKRNISVYLPDDTIDYVDSLMVQDSKERGRGAIIAEIIRKDIKRSKRNEK